MISNFIPANSCWSFVAFFALAFGVCANAILCRSAIADDPVAKKLLKDFWSHTQGRQADAFYLSVGRKSKEAMYAYALVKSKQHDVKKALAAIEELHKMDDTALQPWRLKAWLLLRQDEFNRAALAVEQFIQRVTRDKSLDDFSRAEAYRFAGRVFGFLEGPVKNKVNKVTIDTVKRKILFKLDADLLNAFTFDYAQVEAEYQKMMAAKQRHEFDFAKQDEVERKIKFAQLEKVEDQLDQSKDKLNEKSGTIRDQAEQELDAIRQEDVPLAEQQASLESELADVNDELIYLIGDFNYWNNRAFTERHPRDRAYYFRQANRVQLLMADQEFTASQIRNDIRSVLAQRRELRRQFAETNSIAASQLASIDQQLKQINKQQKITSNQKLRTTKPTRKIITRAASLKTKAHSIVTYDQFPLEIERQLLLRGPK